MLISELASRVHLLLMIYSELCSCSNLLLSETCSHKTKNSDEKIMKLLLLIIGLAVIWVIRIVGLVLLLLAVVIALAPVILVISLVL